MVAKRSSDNDVIRLIEKYGVSEAARRLKMDNRGLQRRRDLIESKIGRQITPPDIRSPRKAIEHAARVAVEVKNGVVLVGGDGHYWPGKASTAHRAFVKFCRDMQPAAVVMNGDAFDGATISRHPSIGWETRPSVIEELEAVQERLEEISQAVPRRRPLIWTLGNHDMRFETRLATVAPEFARVHGFHLKDHFPAFTPGWACWINSNVVVKHRFKGGVHATHNNTQTAGLSIVTNHLHSGKVTAYTDYTGTRYGVDTGTLAEPNGPQFIHYSEDNPKNHRSGFAVLTFKDGKLMYPELVTVWDERSVQFRGEVIRV